MLTKWKESVKVKVLKAMKLNKSLGNDGLTVEFYVTFRLSIGNILVDALNEGCVMGSLTISQKTRGYYFD